MTCRSTAQLGAMVVCCTCALLTAALWNVQLARAAGVNARSPGVDGLVLVASPRFLSAVKSHLPKSTLSRVIGEVRLNLVEAPRSELQQHVRRCLPPPPIR